LRARIAAGTKVDGLPKNSKATINDFKVPITPHALTWRARPQGFDEKRDRLTIAVFRDDTPEDADDGTAWRVRRALPDLFSVCRPGGSGKMPAVDVFGFAERTMRTVDSLSCLAPGRYAVDVFLNGALVQSVPMKLDGPAMRVCWSRDLDFTWCVPERWTPWSGDPTRHPWIADVPMRGFYDPRTEQPTRFGGAVTTFYAPANMPEEKRQDYFLRRTLQILLRKDLKGTDGKVVTTWTQAAENTLARRAKLLTTGTDPICSSRSSNALIYRYMTSRTTKNIVHIAITGPHLKPSEA